MRRRPLTLAILTFSLLGACVPVGTSSPVGEQPADTPAAPTCSPVTCPTTAIRVTPVCPTQAPASSCMPQLLPAAVSSGNLTLRSGPSVAHPVLGSYTHGTEVGILGKAPGGGWVVVSAPEGRLGWMYALYLDLPGPLDDVIEVQPTESWIIAGWVVDDSGRPVESVPVIVELGGATDSVVFTDAQGRFVQFGPTSQEGPWRVAVQGVGCQSRVAGNGCAQKGFVLRSPELEFTIGQPGELEFVYEATTMTLRGLVQDSSGATVAATNVFATRLDGASTSGFTDADGVFEIPITAGTWSVYARGGNSQFVEVSEEGYAGDLILIGAD